MQRFDDYVPNLDADINNADWTKSTWDWLDVTNLDELHERLKFMDMTPAQFKKLPMYTRNVDKMPWLKEL